MQKNILILILGLLINISLYADDNEYSYHKNYSYKNSSYDEDHYKNYSSYDEEHHYEYDSDDDDEESHNTYGGCETDDHAAGKNMHHENDDEHKHHKHKHHKHHHDD
jgi:hypothetical protein